jgi:copper resistance protein B
VRRVFAIASLVLLTALGSAMRAGAQQAPAPDPHAGHTRPEEQQPATEPLPPSVAPLTDEDRKAAFPDVAGHPAHDNAINYFVLFAQLEWETGAEQAAFGWDTKGWVGGDRDRLWFRSEGQRSDGDVWDAQTHAMFGRQIARWWDVLVGVRQDFAPGPAQTWAAFGIQGLAPYWFDVEATAYVGADARNHYRLETEYEFLVTNRLVLQPQAEIEIYGKPDLEHDRDVGIATLDFGVRLRYLLRRELAPYGGVVWHQKHFGTADIARANGERTGGARFVAGIRFWL